MYERLRAVIFCCCCSPFFSRIFTFLLCSLNFNKTVLLQGIRGVKFTSSDSDKNNELGSNPTKGIFVLVLFFLRTILCKVFVVIHGVEEKQKSDLEKKGPSRPSIF